MPTYTVVNPAVFVACVAGCNAGMVASGYMSDTTAADYQPPGLVSAAFAEELDTLWGSTPVDSLSVAAVQEMCENLWAGRSVGPVSTAYKTPGNWAAVCNAIIAAITELETVYSTATGGSPPPIGNGGGTGPYTVEFLGAAYNNPTYSGQANRIIVIDPTGGYVFTPVTGSMGVQGAWLKILSLPGVALGGENSLTIRPVSAGSIQKLPPNQNSLDATSVVWNNADQSGAGAEWFSDGTSPIPNMLLTP